MSVSLRLPRSSAFSPRSPSGLGAPAIPDALTRDSLLPVDQVRSAGSYPITESPAPHDLDYLLRKACAGAGEARALQNAGPTRKGSPVVHRAGLARLGFETRSSTAQGSRGGSGAPSQEGPRL